MSETRDLAALSHSGFWYLLHRGERKGGTWLHETELEEGNNQPETFKELQNVRVEKFWSNLEMKGKPTLVCDPALNKRFSWFPSRPKNQKRWSLKPVDVTGAV